MVGCQGPNPGTIYILYIYKLSIRKMVGLPGGYPGYIFVYIYLYTIIVNPARPLYI